MDEVILSAVRAGMSKVKVASAYDKVYNDECVLSFDTPFSPEGLYVSLSSFQGYSERHVKLDHEKTGTTLYVHCKWTKVLKEPPAEEKAEAPTRMAIGGEGGFNVEETFDVVKENSLVIMPQGTRVLLPCPELPELVINAATALINHASANAEPKEAAIGWEHEIKPSKYADELVQLPPHKAISPDPSTWVCEESGMRENLWLNLSDGHIGSGRRQWDGSGGTNGALNHYQTTKELNPPHGFPLVVKLGTITPTGADVYSYAEDEDDLVTDPKLAEHLAHWGINTQVMEKTEKSMTELNIEANEKLELDKITEAGKELTPLHGPGYVGLSNLGNSCYINSVLQVLAAVPEFGSYCAAAPQIFRSAPSDPTQDAVTQLAKVAEGLLTARYATPASDGETECAIAPRMFKHVVGKGHAEFATARQQDAYEYFCHLLELVKRTERTAASRLGDEHAAFALSPLFSFRQEERIEAGGMVTYKTVEGVRAVPLTIPLEAATNKEAVDAYTQRAEKRQKLDEAGGANSSGGAEKKEEPVVPLVPFEACLSRLAAAEALDDFRGLGAASKTVRFKTFPRYLVVHMQRYVQKPDWTIGKLSVEVPVPEALDLTALRATGLQPSETPMPEQAAPAAEPAAAAPAAAAPPQPDEAIIVQLVSMGFSENGSKRAALAVNNSSADQAMEWVFAHMEDADFNDPLPPPGEQPAAGGGGSGGGSGGGAPAADAAAIEMLGAMGFTPTQAEGALKATNGNVERAADWLFSHSDDLDAAVAEVLGGGGGGGGGGEGEGAAQYDDGPGQYDLLGFISHMGSNTACGHYVCHIKKEGRWILFNDRKVAASESTPLHLGYIYFYKRRD